MPPALSFALPNSGEQDEHGLPGTRQERQLMRQRGAGSRHITNIDFGFAFPTPRQGLVRRQSTRTPRTLRKPRHRPWKTPEHRDGSTSPARPPSEVSARSGKSVKVVNNRADEVAEDLERPAPKRRKLNDITNVGRLAKPSLSDTDEHRYVERVGFVSGRDGDSRSSQGVHPLGSTGSASVVEGQSDQENLQLVEKDRKRTNKRKKRKSIGQQSLFRKNRKLIDSNPQNLPGEVAAKAVIQRRDLSHNRSQTPRQDNIDEDLRPDLNDPEEGISQQASSAVKGRKKRRSTIGHRSKRESAEVRVGGYGESFLRGQPRIMVESVPVQVLKGKGAVTNSVRLNDEDNHSDGLEADNNGLPHLSASSEEQLEYLEDQSPQNCDLRNLHSEPSDDEYRPDTQTRDRISARNRRRKPSRCRFSRPSKPSTRRDGAFPVTIHRTNNFPTLPTIRENDNFDSVPISEDDLLAVTSSAFSRKSQPNAIEVLSQICTEIITKQVAVLERSQSANLTTSSSVRIAQLSLLENFSTDLISELLTLSQTLDNRIHLEARLRRSQREKTALQAQWLAVRQKRDRLALKGDRIRREHWEEERGLTRASEISEAAHKAEMHADDAVMDDQPRDLEFLLKKVSADMSSHAGGIGILDQVRRLNNLLETMVGAT